MRNMQAYKPAPRVGRVKSMDDVFRPASDGDGEEWVKTSVSLRRDTRRRAKRFAYDHDMSLQEVVDAALQAYMDGGIR